MLDMMSALRCAGDSEKIEAEVKRLKSESLHIDTGRGDHMRDPAVVDGIKRVIIRV